MYRREFVSFIQVWNTDQARSNLPKFVLLSPRGNAAKTNKNNRILRAAEAVHKINIRRNIKPENAYNSIEWQSGSGGVAGICGRCRWCSWFCERFKGNLWNVSTYVGKAKPHSETRTSLLFAKKKEKAPKLLGLNEPLDEKLNFEFFTYQGSFFYFPSTAPYHIFLILVTKKSYTSEIYITYSVMRTRERERERK